MTKRRDPLSAHHAVRAIAELIGWPEAGAIVDRGERCVRDWSDPDTPGGVPLHAALLLDVAHVVEGGGVPPLLSWYRAAFERVVGDLPLPAGGHAERLASAAEESGEAIAALVRARLPGACRDAVMVARRECREAIAAFHAAEADLHLPGAVHA